MPVLGRIHLTLMIGKTIPVPVKLPLSDALLSAQVTVTAGQAGGFQLVFDLAKVAIINEVLLPTGYFDAEIRVILVVTVNGIPTVLMDGIITQQELDVSNQAGSSTLTITGQDLTALMDLVENNSTPFPSLTDAERATKIISGYGQYGITPLVVKEIFPYAPDPNNEPDFQQGTDLAYLNQIAQDNGYVFYLDPGPVPGQSTAYWGPEVRTGVAQPALTKLKAKYQAFKAKLAEWRAKFNKWRQDREKNKQADLQDRLEEIIKRIQPKLQDVLERGVRGPVLDVTLDSIRLWYRLSELAVEGDQIWAELNPRLPAMNISVVTKEAVLVWVRQYLQTMH